MSQPKPLTPSNILEALGSSSAHWARMINWVRTTRKLDAVADACVMRNGIAEYWRATHCACCKLVHGYHNSVHDCTGCPVTPACDRLDSLWWGVHRAHTWGEWLTAAHKMHRHLRDRYHKLKKEIRSAESKVQ